MPTAAELDRLDGLVKRLAPIANVERGELIRAGDWNAVVGALIEVARAVLADASVAAAQPHEHVDMVTVGWLDPRLRALIERGPLAEPTAVGRFDAIDRQLTQAITRMSQLDDTIREARTIASDVATRDEKRETDLNTIRRTLEGIPDAREDVLTLRETLRGMQADVRRAIEIGAGLQVGDQPFNAGQFDERLRSVEQLRQRLTAPSGVVLDASALERRLTELTNTFVTEPHLDEVLANRPIEVPPDRLAALEETVANRLQDQFTTEISQASTALRAEMTNRFGEVEGIVVRAIGDSVPNITDSVLGVVRGEVADRLGATRAELLASLQEQTTGSEGRLLTAVDQRLGETSARITADLQARLDSGIAGQVGPLRARMDRLDEASRQNADAIGRLDQSQTANAARIEAISRDADQGRRVLQTTLLAEMDRRLQQQLATFDQRLTEIDGRIRDRITVAINDAVSSLSPQLQQIAGDAARREAQIAASQVRGETREIVREEVATAAEGVRTSLRADIDRAFATVPGLVSGEVRRATSGLSDLVRTEVNSVRTIEGRNPGNLGPFIPGRG